MSQVIPSFILLFLHTTQGKNPLASLELARKTSEITAILRLVTQPLLNSTFQNHICQGLLLHIGQSVVSSAVATLGRESNSLFKKVLNVAKTKGEIEGCKKHRRT